ncbi:tryptophan synthase subunit beta like protein [Deefgea piscis]|uniref:Tryptophan synthase subunit beta like protein n=1 Tax=Deefgea piscis TaxID=2739061 RepID=A0A6M8SS44_9NEIS|nr:tryptophan synthase subunit beta like protein [Deefgea piscis]QKJ66898.1 tryptophan synthase subunit beta like protein [Deefgea piscis]QZA82078.1 hypothetical protein K4H25_05385 [Deefgea piscis]
MFYARRNAQGEIITLSVEASAENQERLDSNHPDVVNFLVKSDEVFYSLDTDLIRVIEDLVDVLIDKNVLRLTDLPLPAQSKLLSRKKVRNTLKNSLNILVDNDEGLI